MTKSRQIFWDEINSKKKRKDQIFLDRIKYFKDFLFLLSFLFLFYDLNRQIGL